MSQPNRIVAIALSAVMLLSVVGAGMAVADEDENGELSMDVEQDGDVYVTVTDEAGDGVADHGVNVTVDDENASYAEAGEHETDENGTVVLAAPADHLNATFEAEGVEATQSLELAAADDEGDDEDDERADGPFGQQVSAFVHGLLGGDGDENKSIGQQVSEFVTQNNPGNAPDHAGPGNETGQPDHAGPGNETGQPDHAGNDDETGQPDHAGGDDERSGPPAHAGPSDGDDDEGESNGASAEAGASASAHVAAGN